MNNKENIVEITDNMQDKISESLVEVSGFNMVAKELLEVLNDLNNSVVQYIFDERLSYNKILEQLATTEILIKTVVYASSKCNSETFSRYFDESIGTKYLEILDTVNRKISVNDIYAQKIGNKIKDEINKND